MTAIDIGRQDEDVQAAAFFQKGRDFGEVVALHAEQSGHVLFRVVALEIGRLHSDDGVIGGVGFVEAVIGEEFDHVEDFFSRLFVDAVLGTALPEDRPMFVELLRQFLGDGFAHQIGFAQFVAK